MGRSAEQTFGQCDTFHIKLHAYRLSAEAADNGVNARAHLCNDADMRLWSTKKLVFIELWLLVARAHQPQLITNELLRIYLALAQMLDASQITTSAVNQLLP